MACPEVRLGKHSDQASHFQGENQSQRGQTALDLYLDLHRVVRPHNSLVSATKLVAIMGSSHLIAF